MSQLRMSCFLFVPFATQFKSNINRSNTLFSHESNKRNYKLCFVEKHEIATTTQIVALIQLARFHKISIDVRHTDSNYTRASSYSVKFHWRLRLERSPSRSHSWDRFNCTGQCPYCARVHQNAHTNDDVVKIDHMTILMHRRYKQPQYKCAGMCVI